MYDSKHAADSEGKRMGLKEYDWPVSRRHCQGQIEHVCIFTQVERVSA